MRCMSGFEGIPANYTCSNSKLMGSMPGCVKKKCTAASIPTFEDGGQNVNFSHECPDGEVGDYCKVSCPERYQGAPALAECMQDAKWGTFPKCVPEMCDVKTLPNGVGVDPEHCAKTGQRFGDTCVLSCRAGFVGEATNITCSSDYKFSGGAPSCTRTACIIPAFVDSTMIHDCNDRYVDDTCSVLCAPGYEGTAGTYTCRSTGAFDPSTPPVCNPKPCSGGLPFGMGINISDCSGRVTNETCSLKCNAGYNIVSGSTADFHCLKSGFFDGSTFECEPARCGDLSAESGYRPQDGVANSCADLRYLETCSAWCDDGWDITGPVANLACSSPGDTQKAGFLGDTVTCTARECTQGIPSKLGLKNDCAGKTTGQTCQVEVDDGYEYAVGSQAASMKCEPSGTFVFQGSSLPEVEVMNCTDGNETAQIGTSCTNKAIGDSCWWYCKTGDLRPKQSECKYASGSAQILPISGSVSCSRRLGFEHEGAHVVDRRLNGACDGSIDTLFSADRQKYDWNDCMGSSDLDICIVGCARGYTIDGNATGFKCVTTTFKATDGSSAAVAPSCTASNCSTGMPYGLGVTHNCSSTPTGQSCHAFCDLGYSFTATSGPESFTCKPTGELSGTNPECQRITCAVAGDMTHARYDSSACNGTKFGASCVVACGAGYEANSTLVTCAADKSFEGGLPTCTRRTCGAASLPQKSPDIVLEQRCNSMVFEDTCIISCAEGYTGSNSVFTCVADGSISGALPACAPKPCDDLVETSMIRSSCLNKSFGEECSMSCKDGFAGSPVVRTCETDGTEVTFSGSAPNCVPKMCVTAIESCKNTSVLQTCELSCGQGYESNSSTMTCRTDQFLDGAAPTCTRASCNALQKGENQSVTCDRDSSPYLYGDTCDVSCKEGYTSRDGTKIWTCDGSAGSMSFTGSAVACEKETCIYNLLPASDGKFEHDCSSLAVNETCSLSCNADSYEQTGNSIVYTCGSDLVLAGDGYPTCTLKEVPSNTSAGETSTAAPGPAPPPAPPPAASPTPAPVVTVPESNEAASVNRVIGFVASVLVAAVVAALGDS